MLRTTTRRSVRLALAPGSTALHLFSMAARTTSLPETVERLRTLPLRGRTQALSMLPRDIPGLGVRPFASGAAIHRAGVRLPEAFRVGRSGSLAQMWVSMPHQGILHAPRVVGRPSTSSHGPLAHRLHLSIRSFHVSSRHQGIPALFAAGTLLKSTAAIGAVTTIARVLFTLLPFQIFVRWRFLQGIRRHAMKYPKDLSETAITFFETHCMGEWIERPNTKGMKCTPEDELRLIEASQSESMRRCGLEPEAHRDLFIPDPDPRKVRAYSWLLVPLTAEAEEALQTLTTAERRDLYRIRRYEAKQIFFNYKAKLIGRIILAFVAFPIVLVLLTALVSLERVPYTGRWRTIMLSPDEENVITSRLAGPGWFAAVINLLTTAEEAAPRVVPIDDWRWRWVNGVMRRLETSVVASCHDTQHIGGRDIAPDHAVINGKKVPLAYPPPPNPAHPLRPRPRAAASLHSALPGGDPDAPSSHHTIGPPYSLLLLDKDEANALSYGFGANGAGGVVVFTGILDQILASGASEGPPEVAQGMGAEGVAPAPTLVQSLLGTRPSPTPALPRRSIPQPTEKQSLQLATVLAHELAHLLLSHHLEAISVTKVALPSMLSIFSDMARAIVFPITFVFGPFVNDAIASMSKAGVNEWALLSDNRFSKLHEKEADIVALRILAYAGYDPKAAVDAWADIAKQTCQPGGTPENTTSVVYKPSTWSMFQGGVHATAQARYEATKKELRRWEAEAQVRAAAAPSEPARA